jgi:hypothetical protein
VRTTVTLDPDVERLIRNVMKERGISFKEALNEAARKGFRNETQKRLRRFVQKSFPLGQTSEACWDKALATAEAMEDQELSRKLSLG